MPVSGGTLSSRSSREGWSPVQTSREKKDPAVGTEFADAPVILPLSSRRSVLRSFRRLPALAAILALSLVAGPAASAVCAHVGLGTHEMEGTPMERPAEAPCHEGPAEDAPAEAPPPASHSGADCDAPCCVVAAERAAPTLSVTAPPAVERSGDKEEIARAPEPAAAPAMGGMPPPPRLYQETGRVRI